MIFNVKNNLRQPAHPLLQKPYTAILQKKHLARFPFCCTSS
ncbi:hypothetical protein HMPREF9098_2219 [Kingella denitrificans ATCC 33394]|uniref:Uncharacterized protein n=1 Tax=Kingella denitrificans ATCC 33394 TaxID=888741 RepID=F0F284_9NEIS|nr:hypothetical protein HMPREF9098_2219 [Kingella denitrificans ATCC 33394]